MRPPRSRVKLDDDSLSTGDSALISITISRSGDKYLASVSPPDADTLWPSRGGIRQGQPHRETSGVGLPHD
jgi:hypothetical protein